MFVYKVSAFELPLGHEDKLVYVWVDTGKNGRETIDITRNELAYTDRSNGCMGSLLAATKSPKVNGQNLSRDKRNHPDTLKAPGLGVPLPG
jgi:hypothetical protein